jgi:hypothetical protein
MAFFSIFACQNKVEKDAIPELIELLVLDSTLIFESDYFINGQNLVRLVGDSLLAISSLKTPSVNFLKIDGEQVGQIASKEFPMAPFRPSSFDVSEYPIVYILDKKSESVLEFNVEIKQFIKKIKLSLPENKRPKMAGGKFKKIANGFIIELESSVYDNYNPDYFRKSGDLIFRFDIEGNVKDSFLEYPEELKSMIGSMQPINYLQSTANEKSMLFTFPHEKIIKRFEFDDGAKIVEEISLPKSRYFDFQPVGADQIISFEDLFNSGEGMNIKIPTNHYFISIHEINKLIVIETWMNNRQEPPNYATYSNLLIYDKEEKKWYETSNPRNILDIGMLAGVVNDTLYFYEGSLMKSDEKYIKRAVLKPIKE